jgi:acetyl esterase
VGACAALVYFHGGGFAVGEPRYWRDVACELVRSGGFAVVLVDYRLAPEHPFPAAYEDGVAVVRYLRERGSSLGIDPQRIAIGGDSAGANLALAVSAALTSAGKRSWLAAVLLIYGVYSRVTAGASWRQLGRFGLSSELMQWIWQNYLQGTDRADWRAFPLEADLANLPPVVSVVGELDPLIADNVELKRRLDDLHIANTLTIVPGLTHGVVRLGACVPKVRGLVQQSATALKKHLSC